MKTINIMLIICLISLFIAACTQQAENNSQTEEEEFVDTGILAVESSPSGADVYVNDKIEGQTPLTLYNMPVGNYNIKIVKEGYNDFMKDAVVKVGLTEEIDARLNPIQKEVPSQQEEQQEPQPEAAINKIELASFAMYHDFESKSSSQSKSPGSDIFSRKYKDYVDLTAMVPGKIAIINKNLNEIAAADCINADKGVLQVKPGESICILTVEGNYFAAQLKSMNEMEYARLS